MRRKDREVTEMASIMEIVDACDIIRIGLADGDYPYIVPLNFAYRLQGDKLEFYVHGAMAGRKYELMKKNGKCSFEMDVPLQLDCVYAQKSVTMRYESVMGTALIDFLEGEQKQQAIDNIIMERYEETRGFEYNKGMVGKTAVARLTVKELTAKRNPIPENPSRKEKES